jgi:hypothetical protein
MERESFRDRNRRRREENAFENLYAYAKEAKIPDPKRTAERTARVLHRDGIRENGGPGAASGPDDDATALEERTKEELYEQAKELEIEGRSSMNKDELVRAIEEHEE